MLKKMNNSLQSHQKNIKELSEKIYNKSGVKIILILIFEMPKLVNLSDNAYKSIKFYWTWKDPYKTSKILIESPRTLQIKIEEKNNLYFIQ